MHDCTTDVLAYHDEKVTLSQAQRTEMEQRRNANRDRVKSRLPDTGRPAPRHFKSQGSYAMRTMLQHPANDYGIDDGAYFHKEDLVGARGADMTALQTRQMVRDALDDGRFVTPPEVRKNCVRVHYSAGYHVDMPIYRRVTTTDAYARETYHFELASSTWTRSDARHVTDWFESENDRQSSDATNGRQLRRVVRMIKKFARSRGSWSGQILSGFGITALVVEVFRGHATRDDVALYETMRAIRVRLHHSLEIRHPVTPGATITKPPEDPRARFLRDRLVEALDALSPLFLPDCTREMALGCWDKVFNTIFFAERLDRPLELKSLTALAAPAVLTSGLVSSAADAARSAVRKEGGGRYA